MHLMTTKIGPGGFVDLVSSELGPQRQMRIISFTAPAAPGAVSHPMFKAGENPIAIIDMNFGRNVVAAFGAASNGSITQTDTGGLGADGTMAGHTMWAILGDTGTAGI
jgi:hypothetical protein